MLTYQDFEKATDVVAFINRAIGEHIASAQYRTAIDADAYNRQLNVTIYRLARLIREKSRDGRGVQAADNCLASNFFKRLNRQRVAYLLGNGVSFTQKERRVNENGVPVEVDVIKERLGDGFDGALMKWAYKALIHGVCFAFWDETRVLVYPMTEFKPLWDEKTGALRAGIRFWRLEPNKPLRVELYEEDGYTVYASRPETTGNDLVIVENKRKYRQTVSQTAADGEWVSEEENYTRLPIIPMYGCEEKQSTLVGMRPTIDAIDIIASGYANDEQDCSKIYWLIENCGAMDDEDMQKFLEDIRVKHIAKVDSTSFSGDARSALTPYTQEVPWQGREAVLNYLQKRLYEDFGALDVHAVAAGATNDHIDAAYQPLDDEADMLEAQVIEAVQKGLALWGIEDTPQFKRNRVSNLNETIQGVMLEGSVLDTEAILELLPNITVDMNEAILARMDRDAAARLVIDKTKAQTPADLDGGEGESA